MIRYISFRCAYCKLIGRQKAGAVNRARRIDAPLYCDRACSGAAKWKNQTPEELKERKRLYDIEYRAKNLERIKAGKVAYFKRTYDPAKAAVERKKRAKKHAAYCRRPDYRAKKHEYDKRRYAQEFGHYAECVGLLQDLKAEIASRMSPYDIRMANGYYEKQNEKRKQRRLANGENEFHRR